MRNTHLKTSHLNHQWHSIKTVVDYSIDFSFESKNNKNIKKTQEINNIPIGIFLLYLYSTNSLLMGKAAETRQYIIEKTAPIFNKKGFSGTTMSDLTNSTGLTKGAIYGNFANKDEVAIEVFKFNRNKVWNMLLKNLNQVSKPKDKLLMILNFYEENITSLFLNGGCPLLNSAIDTDDTHEALFKVVQASFVKWKENLTTLIEEAQNANEINQDIVPEEFANCMISMIEGSILVCRTLNSTAPIKSNFKFLKQQLIH